ncbi:peptide chain release factor 2 [Candidatus Roizmanbacteria bacterium]|nr:peptide chain release factor 2 [Candidatus Roizmanbacteria bacterium]
MEELKDELTRKLANILEKADLANKRILLSDLEKKTYDASFWQDAKAAGDTLKKITLLKKEVEDLEMMPFLMEEQEYKEAEKLIKQYEMLLFLSGPYDKSDAVFSIHAGQGGTEAMDWSDMLFRMYTRYCELKGWRWEEVDRIDGEEAGIKSITLNIHGQFAYGYLKAEAGVHRLVRQSPFNADKLRQTSFSLVEVLPVVEDQAVEVREEDLEWQFYRSGGKGGQNVNKVSTAVRLTHKPSQVTVSCQTERSQGQNRENALKILRSKLWAIEEAKRQKAIAGFKNDKMASWGMQIRSYVLHPYKLIKDLRTDFEETNVNKILDGDLDEIIEAYLKFKA